LATVGVLTASMSWWVGFQIQRQQTRNDLLTQEQNKLSAELAEISRLEGEISSLSRRIDTIASLDIDRTLLNALIQQLLQTIPPEISLADFSVKSKSIEISGQTSSNERLSEWLNSLAKQDALVGPSLKVVKQDPPITQPAATTTKDGKPIPPVQMANTVAPKSFSILAQANRKGPEFSVSTSAGGK
jgi:Tfp pilus assembly protein PilN